MPRHHDDEIVLAGRNLRGASAPAEHQLPNWCAIERSASRPDGKRKRTVSAYDGPLLGSAGANALLVGPREYIECFPKLDLKVLYHPMRILGGIDAHPEVGDRIWLVVYLLG